MATATDNRDGESRLADAIATANVPTLACLLVHLTGERRWIEPPYVPSRTRGLDDNDSGDLPEPVQAEIRSAAAACGSVRVLFHGRSPDGSRPETWRCRNRPTNSSSR